MIQVIWLYDKAIYVDDRRRMICFNTGADCVRYRTVKQFDVAFETLMKMIEYCRKNEGQ